MVNLSDAEWILMNRLWERESTITELTKEMGKKRGWTKSTIITMLVRLEKKGAVSYREEGRTKHFYPLINRKEAALQETEGFLNKVYQGSVAMMINAMAGGKRLTAKEIDELKELLQELEGRMD